MVVRDLLELSDHLQISIVGALDCLLHDSVFKLRSRVFVLLIPTLKAKCDYYFGTEGVTS